jgi:CubicO group peptidase (beta-lactamase class C family)
VETLGSTRVRGVVGSALAMALALALALAGWGLMGWTASAAAVESEPPPATLAAPAAVLDLWVEEQLAYRGLPGLVLGVVHDQELVWARGYGVEDLESGKPMTPQSLFRLGSITKLFTSTVILQLRDAGSLRLDDPVSKHLPWFSVVEPPVNDPVLDQPEITLRHLLTHTAGLPREAAFPYWTDHRFPSRAELQRVVPGQQAIYPPGTHYKYSNLGIALLGAVVEAVAGRPYERYLLGLVFRPLGMESTSAAPDEEMRRRLVTGYGRRLADGSREVLDYYDTDALAPAANIVSTLEDLAKFAALQFSDGPAGGAQILRGATLREMQQPHWVYPSWEGGRGLGWAIARRDGKTMVLHGGWVAGNRCHLLLVPEEKIAILAMTNADDGSPSFFANHAYDLLAPALVAAAAHQATREAAAPEVPTPAAWQSYLGRYTDPWGWEYQVMVRGEELLLYEYSYPPEDEPGAGVTVLEPVSGDSFRLPDGELLTFELDEGGAVQRIHRRSDYLYPLDTGPQFDTRPRAEPAPVEPAPVEPVTATPPGG